MDGYEAVRMVLTRIQSFDPENASKIMGFLLLQDSGEKEMIRLALGPDALLRSVLLRARSELGLAAAGAAASPWAAAPPFFGSAATAAQEADRLPFFLDELDGEESDFIGLHRSRSFSGNGGDRFRRHGFFADELEEHQWRQRELMLRSMSLRAPPYSPPSPPPATARMAALMAFPGDAAAARQIYLTFPADSTFSEEDVSNYFSNYGPVQDVRIPYQQKRMFGFVSFVFPETARMVLSQGNPHFVCDARVLVKPYKEKGKIIIKKQQQMERSELSGFCASPPGWFDSRDAIDALRQGPRAAAAAMNGGHDELFLFRRKLEEQRRAEEQRQAAIALQGRRLMGLQLLDVATAAEASGQSSASSTPSSDDRSSSNENQEELPFPPSSDKLSNNHVDPQQQQLVKVEGHHEWVRQVSVKVANNGESAGKGRSPKEEQSEEGNAAHNLPDSPFASQPTELEEEDDPFTMALSSSTQQQQLIGASS